MAAVATTTPDKIDSIIKTTIRKSPLRRGSGELKFYTASEKAKVAFFKKVVKGRFDIFVLIVVLT